MKVPKLKFPKFSKKSQKYVIYFVITLVIIIIGAFLYFKTNIIRYNVECMSATGYKGNTDLKRNDSERELKEINDIVKGNIIMTDIEGNVAARKNLDDIKSNSNYLSNSLYKSYNLDKDPSKGTDTGKYITSSDKGSGYISAKIWKDAQTLLQNKGWESKKNVSSTKQTVLDSAGKV